MCIKVWLCQQPTRSLSPGRQTMQTVEHPPGHLISRAGILSDDQTLEACSLIGASSDTNLSLQL